MRATKRALELDPYYVSQKFALAIDLQYETISIGVVPEISADVAAEHLGGDFAFDQRLLDNIFKELEPAATAQPAGGGVAGLAKKPEDPLALARDYVSKGMMDLAVAEATRAVQRDFLLAELKRKAPALDAITVDYDWAGWVCITADAMPYIHHAEDDPTVVYALGYQGSGVALALHAGKILADRLGGRPVPDLPPAFSPLPRFPLAALRRTAQRAAFRWWRFMDERG